MRSGHPPVPGPAWHRGSGASLAVSDAVAVRAERSGVPAAGNAAPSALDGVPFGQPALALAAQLQRRAARAGAPEKLTRLAGAAAAPGASGPDLGRQLFRLVAKARELDLDPETELRAAARRYRDLVRAWERSGPAPDR